MNTFIVKIKCENAAFEESEEAEIARILREVATRIENNGAGHPGAVFDANGNRVGSYGFNLIRRA